MAANKIGGTAYLTIDGAQYSLKGSFSYSLQTSTKEGVAGQDGVHGYTEKPHIPTMKGTLSDLGGVSVTTLADLTDVTIIAELNNGKTVTLTETWVSGEITVNTEDGTYEVTWQGMDGIEEVSE